MFARAYPPVSEEFQDARHLRNPLRLLLLIALLLLAHLPIIHVPRKRGEVHREDHLHGCNLERGEGDVAVGAHEVVHGEVRHLDPEDDPGHALAPDFERGERIGEEAGAQELGEAEAEVEDAEEEEGRGGDADDVLSRRREEGEGVGQRGGYDEKDDELRWGGGKEVRNCQWDDAAAVSLYSLSAQRLRTLT